MQAALHVHPQTADIVKVDADVTADDISCGVSLGKTYILRLVASLLEELGDSVVHHHLSLLQRTRPVEAHGLRNNCCA